MPSGSTGSSSASASTSSSSSASGSQSSASASGDRSASSPSSGSPDSGRESGSTAQSSGSVSASTGSTAGITGSLPGLDGAASGSDGSASGQAGSGASGNYSLDNLPGSLGDSAGGPQTAAERAQVLTGELNRGYEDFDGVILAERARAQAQAAAARNTEIPGDSGGAGSSGTGTGGSPIIVSRDNTMPSGTQGSRGVGGGATSGDQAQSFPPPEDIPSGRDDDIVARQLREAAMTEADPELREALWDEYRKYTGIGN